MALLRRRPQLAALALSGLVVACGAHEPPAEAPATSATAPTPTTRDPGTLVFAVQADVTGIYPNPPMVSEGYTLDVMSNVFGTLVSLDAQLRPQPALAERWENPDETTYVFELREGLRFADGQPLMAADVAASLTAVGQRRWPSRDLLQAIASVSADGPRRVVIRTREPYTALLHRLHRGFVLPASAVNDPRVPPVASGPYELVEWSPGKELTLRRNPHYFGQAAPFEHVRYQVVPDPAERVAMVQEGRADVADSLPLERLNDLDDLLETQLVAEPGLRVLFLGLRVDKPPFADPLLREALDRAIDRQVLVERALHGHGRVATQPAAPAVFGFAPMLPEPAADAARVGALLAAAGPEGLAVRLDVPLDRYAGGRAVADEVVRQAREVGIRIEVNALPKGDFFRLIDAGESRLHLLGWSCNSGDVSEVLESLFHTPVRDTLGSYNSLGLSDPELDRLIAASQRVNPRERLHALQACMGRVVAGGSVLPLAVPTEALLLSRRIEWTPPIDLALRPAEMRPAR